MDRDTIIDGLRMTMDLFTFDPTTGEEKDPDDLNDLDRATYDACKGALEILERLDTDSDTISRQTAIDALLGITAMRNTIPLDSAIFNIKKLPSAQPEIIRCKDCRKHNKKVGFDENFHTVWKEDACPLVSWRGKAKGHEFDYQFCACGERREVTT